MKIIAQTPGSGGAYPPIQECSFAVVPAGTALWPETVPTDTFYQYNGFVELDMRETEGVTVVTGCRPNQAAWEAWRAELPEEPEPEPSAAQVLDVLLGGGE